MRNSNDRSEDLDLQSTELTRLSPNRFVADSYRFVSDLIPKGTVLDRQGHGKADFFGAIQAESVLRTRRNLTIIESELWSTTEVQMKLSESVKPVSYFKAHASELIRDVVANRRTVVITQNGEARVVLQGVQEYEQMQESLALLKMLSQSKKSLDEGRL